MKRIVLGIAISLSLGVGLSGVSGCAGKKPRMTAADLAMPVAEVPTQSFIRHWVVDTQPAKGHRIRNLYEAGDYLFAIDTQNLSTVIRKDTGAVVAIHEIRAAGEVLPPFTNGKLFAYPSGTEIWFFDTAGGLVRRVDIKSGIRGGGAFSPTTAYLGVSGLNGGRLRAVDVNRVYGTAKWEILTGGALIAAPVYFDQQVFFATEDGHVYAVDEEKNNTWALPAGYYEAGPVTADLTADDAGLYVASTDSKLTCIDRRTGRTKWQYFSGSPLDRPAIPTLDTVYLPVPGQGLAAINKEDTSFNRQPKWLSRESTDFLADDGVYAYVRLQGNSIAALNRNTGAVAFRSAATGMDFFVPNRAKDATIFAANKEGFVVGVTPVTKPGTIGEQMFAKPAK